MSKQNLVKRNFPYIDTFNHKGPVVISVMRNITVGVFEHLKITSPMNVDKRLSYTQIILRGAALKKYQEVLVTYGQSAREFAVDECTLGKLTGIFAEYFWTWEKADTTGYDGHG